MVLTTTHVAHVEFDHYNMGLTTTHVAHVGLDHYNMGLTSAQCLSVVFCNNDNDLQNFSKDIEAV
jgi:hypothetical protein